MIDWAIKCAADYLKAVESEKDRRHQLTLQHQHHLAAFMLQGDKHMHEHMLQDEQHEHEEAAIKVAGKEQRKALKRIHKQQLEQAARQHDYQKIILQRQHDHEQEMLAQLAQQWRETDERRHGQLLESQKAEARLRIEVTLLQRALDAYPFAGQPGAFAHNLRYLPEHIPLVLITPAKDEATCPGGSTSRYARLHTSAQSALAARCGQLCHVPVGCPARWFSLPHHDIQMLEFGRRPTLVVSPVVNNGRVSVYVGAANFNGPGVIPSREFFEVPFVLERIWSEAWVVAFRNAVALLGRAPDEGEPPDSLAEHAAEFGIVLSVLHALDQYYLSRLPYHDELIGEKSTDLELHVGLDLLQPLALESIRTPAYHLLNRARAWQRLQQPDRAHAHLIAGLALALQLAPCTDLPELARALETASRQNLHDRLLDRALFLIKELPQDDPARCLEPAVFRLRQQPAPPPLPQKPRGPWDP